MPPYALPVLLAGLLCLAALGLFCRFLLPRLSPAARELILYLVFGVLTTAVSIGSYALLHGPLGMHYLAANVASWVVSVLFAFCTNRSFVFSGGGTGWPRQLLLFALSRLGTLAVEEAGLFLLVDLLSVGELAAKAVMQAVVIVLNYILSKFLVFQRREKHE